MSFKNSKQYDQTAIREETLENMLVLESTRR